MRLPIPKSLARRLEPLGQRINRFLREWEWTWTKAVVTSLATAFFSLIVLAVIPSFWLYFADQTLRWKSFWLVKLTEAVAAGWITVWFGIIFVAAYILQSQRRKVRGEGGDTRPTGGYR
jgi:hypothetical protein